MGILPSARVRPGRAFAKTGIDYAGPIQLRTTRGRGHKAYKGYIALFICMVTKAIHIEIVSDLTTDSFIAAYKRFTSRRGLCTDIFSDNGTYFIGASNIMKKEYQRVMTTLPSDIAVAIAKDETNWHFIPPLTPHFGGIWEAGIKSVKFHLKRVIGDSTLTFEELYTVATQIEGCLNSRPLTPLTNDPTDLSALTPGHFLIGDSLKSMPVADLGCTSLRTRWHLVEKMVHDFWKRWSSEYLHQLQQRTKWKSNQPNLMINDLVLLKDEQLPATRWKLGRVTETHVGKDGLVRVATIKCENTTYKRPIGKLCKLPIEENFKENDVVRPVNQPAADKPDDSTPLRRTNKPQRIPRAGTNQKLILNTFSIFCVLGLIAAEATAKFNITSFTYHPGIYFDKMGQGNLVNGQWKIITFYNLTTYWAELNHLEKCTLDIDRLCSNSSIHIRAVKNCAVILAQIQNRYTELKEQNEIIDSLGSTSRQKRSPFDFVGTVANELFGVLDQRAARAYKESIERLNTNQDHHQMLLEQQTSILESTVNIMKHDHEQAVQKFEAFDRIVDDLTYYEELSELYFYTILEMIKLRTFQSAVIDTITEVHQGKLNPLILTPHQLGSQIKKIMGNLKPDQDVPYRNKDIANIYKIASVKTIKVEETIIFEIKIPLVQRTKYILYHIIPVPTVHHQEYVYIQPYSSHLMVAPQHQQYIPLSTDDVNTCTLVNEEFLCDVRQPIYGYNANISNCEIQLLLHQDKIPTTCQIFKTATTTIWIPLQRYNAWIFVVNTRITCNVVCNNPTSNTIEPITTYISGEGVLELHEDCILKGETFTVSGYKTHSTKFKLSLLPQFNLSDTIIEANTKIKDPITTSTYSDILEIEASIQEHKRQLSLPTSTTNIHDYHHYVAIYIIIPVIFLGSICCILRKIRTTRPNAAQEPLPLPTP